MGDNLENYDKIKVIGHGSYGEVWLVKHKNDKKEVDTRIYWNRTNLVNHFHFQIYKSMTKFYQISWWHQILVRSEEAGPKECLRKGEKRGRAGMSSALPAEAPQHCDLQGIIWDQWRLSLHFNEVLWSWRFVHKAEATERKVAGGETDCRVVHSDCHGSSGRWFFKHFVFFFICKIFTFCNVINSK